MSAKSESGSGATGSGKKPGPPPQSTKLGELALARYRLGVSNEGKPFAYTSAAAHVALPLKGNKLGLRHTLAADYFTKYGVVPSSAALADCCATLEGIARRQPPQVLHIRVAGGADAIYVDMADHHNRVIKISGGAWKIVDSSPYMFGRTELTDAMADPDDDINVVDSDGREQTLPERLDPLWAHINIAVEDRPVLLAWMVDVLIQPGTPKPVATLLAEHGSAKTTTAKRVVSLIDPSTVPVRGGPRDLEQWLTAVAGSWVTALDNMSSIGDWLSDAICRASTGDGNVKRALYTDGELSVAKLRRVVLLNGIDIGGLNGDLTDRLVSIELAPIIQRRAESDLAVLWDADRPVIFAALLDLAAKVHEKLMQLGEIDLPRMADFGRVLACVDEILETGGTQRYYDQTGRALADSALSDSFIARLADIPFYTRGEGETAAEILISVTPGSGALGWKPPADWPKKARTVSSRLAKHAPALRSMGWHVSNDNARNKDSILRWKILPPPMNKQAREDP